MPLAGSGLKKKGDHLNIKIVAALYVVMPTYYLYVEMYDLEQIYLRCTPQGCQPLKKTLVMWCSEYIIFKNNFFCFVKSVKISMMPNNKQINTIVSVNETKMEINETKDPIFVNNIG